jgi:hypothetical protein
MLNRFVKQRSPLMMTMLVGGEQKWRDIWNDMNSLQFIQIAQTPLNDIEEEILWIKKQAQNYVWKGLYQLCF